MQINSLKPFSHNTIIICEIEVQRISGGCRLVAMKIMEFSYGFFEAYWELESRWNQVEIKSKLNRNSKHCCITAILLPISWKTISSKVNALTSTFSSRSIIIEWPNTTYDDCSFRAGDIAATNSWLSTARARWSNSQYTGAVLMWKISKPTGKISNHTPCKIINSKFSIK